MYHSRHQLTVPARYSEGPLFQKSIAQIHATVLTFGLRLGLRSALGLGLGLVGIVDFRNSGPECHLMASVAYVTMRCPSPPLVISSKTKPSQFSSVTLLCTRLWNHADVWNVVTTLKMLIMKDTS